MKILIVDDNANNRMILNLLLQDYAEETKRDFCDIEECENGLIALNMAKETKYDLIFMDIMMPEMDGIEATQKIREYDKDVMIIAVSAVDDELKQKEILRCGAEDYVPKPLDAKQLFTRVDNYFSLINLRKSECQQLNSKSVNLYTKEIFHRQIIFYVENEEALAEFWEYYLLGSETLKVDNLSDVVRAIFSLGDTVVKLNEKPWIIAEADESSLYFTLNKMDALGDSLLKLIMRKNKEVSEFKYDSDKISFKLAKKVTPIEPFETKVIPAVQSEEKSEPVETNESTVHNVQITTTDVDSYRVFNYMDPEDLEETESLVGDLRSVILMLGSSTLEETEVFKIASLLDNIGRRLTVYTESYAIGQSLTTLSQNISSHTGRFQEIANDLSTLSAAFISDLETWLNMTFFSGAPSEDFMNDTIVANSQTISSMLEPEEASSGEADMDDIFDF